MLNDNIKNQLQLHLVVFIWGFTAVLGALISIGALPLVFIRMVIALAIVGIYLIFTKKYRSFSPKEIALFFGAGIVIALHWFTFFHAIKIANVSVTLACLSTGAFFTSLLEPYFFKRPVIKYEVFLGGLVILGLALIFSFETQYFYGILTALTSALLSASFSIINAKLIHKYPNDSVIISFYEILGGVLFLLAVLLIGGSFSLSAYALSASDWLWLFLLGSVCTAYPFIASLNIMRYLSPYTVMLTINLEPIYGILLAVMVFGEKESMTPQFYLGGLIILLTVLANGYFKNTAKRRQKI
ncbi:DMT family transporter [Avrilella dinanensis]|uniref:DMT family transporter n=1 Tax=Avrilella dinanensis TaxID=2008672 RepID=UPI00240A7F1E|nr:DMT family transporter [Avrilella dinanensis]